MEGKPRITFNLTEDGLLELWLNGSGRDLLVKELQRLNERSEHFHFAPEDMGEVEVSTVPYRETDQILDWGKVYLRTDEWDARYYPHVLQPPKQTDP